MTLSPDGKHLAFFREFEGKPGLFFADVDSKNVVRIDQSDEPGTGAQKYIQSYRWIGDRRVIFTSEIGNTYLTGVTAVDCDGQRWMPVSGRDASPYNPLYAFTTIHAFDDGQSILMLDQHTNEGELVLYPDVVKVDTTTGSQETVVKNPGNVVTWGVDHDGVVRFGAAESGDDDYKAIYRETDKTPWHAFHWIGKRRTAINALGFDFSNKKLFITALSPKNRQALYSVDLASGTMSQAILENPIYDISAAPAIPNIYVQPLFTPVVSLQKRSLVGMYYTTEGPRSAWFDPEFARYQRLIDKALPGTVNQIKSGTKDDKSFLVFSFSDRDPGFYSLFDPTHLTLRRLASQMSWIKPDLMSQMYPIHYAARDGLVIHGYLTVPRNHQPKNLPLIVMPHGGPWVRDMWGFDPLVQMLANRGYAVLQMNYRGSIGYGKEFSDIARREIGRGIQNDIEDGARWAVAKGIADRRRLAIVGASYGGYSALFALAHDPDLYQCGISIAGVTDWFSLIKSKTTEGEAKFGYRYWTEQIGNPSHDSSFLQSISPVNLANKITAPVLIIQGEDDQVVPQKQAKSMIGALKNAGRMPESLFIENEGHGFAGEKSRIEEFKRIEAFLAEHLGPGAPIEKAETNSGKVAVMPARS